MTSHDLTWPGLMHSLPPWPHTTPRQFRLQSNQRMFVSATHEVLKFLPTEDLRFKYVGHQGQGTRSEVSNKSWSYKYWDACREQGGREGGRSVKILSVIMSGSRAIHIVPVCRKFANNGGDISPLCGAPVPVSRLYVVISSGCKPGITLQLIGSPYQLNRDCKISPC